MITNSLIRLITFKPNKSIINYAKTGRFLTNGRCLGSPRQMQNKPVPSIARKYQIIDENNSLIIENTADEESPVDKYSILSDEFEGINLCRGASGVFEIDDLVDLLHQENGKDVFVVTVPKEINYVDYICVVSARSKRHITALAEFVRKVYKKKCYKCDSIPKLEGKNADDWIALDLGNIALHIFSEKARKVYDLESLWAVGAEYDDEYNKKTEVDELFQSYGAYLKDLKPLA